MKATTLTFSFKKNVGNYNSAECTITYDVEENKDGVQEDVKEVIKEAIRQVAFALKNSEQLKGVEK